MEHNGHDITDDGKKTDLEWTQGSKQISEDCERDGVKVCRELMELMTMEKSDVER